MIRAQQGFALVELMLVAAMLSVVLGAVLMFLDTAGQVAPRQQERGHAIRQGQVGLERMTRELRQGSTATLVANGTASQEVRFTTWVRPGGAAAVQRQVVYRCSYQTDECWRHEGAVGAAWDSLPATDRLAVGVQNDPTTQPVFSGTPDAAAPKYVGVLLALGSQGSSQPFYLRDGVRLRNAPGV